MQALLENVMGAQEAAASEVVRILQAEALLKQPNKKLCPNFKELRQAYFKQKFHASRRDGGADGGMEGAEDTAHDVAED